MLGSSIPGLLGWGKHEGVAPRGGFQGRGGTRRQGARSDRWISDTYPKPGEMRR